MKTSTSQRPAGTTGIGGRRRLGVFAILSALLLASAACWYFWRPAKPVDPPGLSSGANDPDLVRAVDEARAAIRKKPASAQAWGHLAELFLANQLLGQGQECLEQAMKLDPTDGRWGYLYALMLVRSDTEACISCLQRTVLLCGSIPAPRLKLGEVLLAEGRLDEAEEQFQTVLRFEPGNPRAELDLGRLACTRGQWQESLRHLRNSLEHAPDIRSTHTLLAEVYQRLGETTAANLEAEHAAKSSPDSWPDPYLEAIERLRAGVETRVQLTKTLFKQGRTQEALGLIQETVRSRPESAAAHQAYGHILLTLGRLAEAELQFREAIRLRPEFDRAHAGLGFALLGEGRFKEAAECYRAAMQLHPHQALDHYNLGVCLDKLGDLNGAMEAYRSAVQCNPDFAEGQRELGSLLIKKGQLAEATRCLENAVRLAPSDPVAQELLTRARQPVKGSEKR